ncbi:MAG: hypothetical protein JW904_01095 [Spirochaetales bacterium]|nr:hypothetical protein [Spirochaetales bacterium]
MERTIRPRGLTALAILNFILAGFKGFAILTSLITVMFVGAISQQASYTPGNDFSSLLLIFTIVDIFLVILMVLAGIGYIRVNRFMGLLVGNIFAVASFIKGCISIVSWSELSLPFNVFNMTSFLIISDLVFPVLTIVFLNFVFLDTWRTHHQFYDRIGEYEERTQHPEQAQIQPESGARKHTPHPILVFMQSLRQTLRGSQGILFFYFSIILFLLIGQVTIWICGVQGGFAANDSQNIETSQLMMKFNAKEFAFNHFVWVLDDKSSSADMEAKIPPQWSTMLSHEQPALLSLIFSVVFSLFPVIIAFITFNQIAEDANRKGYRYLLLRTNRQSIFFGKFLSVITLVIPLIIIIVFSISLFVHFIYRIYPIEQILFFSVWAAFAFICISLPSIAFCMMFSAMINSGILSLITSIGILSLGPLILRAFRDIWDPLVVLQFLLPGKAGYFLFHYEWWAILLAFIAMAVYTGLFTAGGYFLFKRKSL